MCIRDRFNGVNALAGLNPDGVAELVAAAGRYINATTLGHTPLSIEEIAVHQAEVAKAKYALETALANVKGGV